MRPFWLRQPLLRFLQAEAHHLSVPHGRQLLLITAAAKKRRLSGCCISHHMLLVTPLTSSICLFFFFFFHTHTPFNNSSLITCIVLKMWATRVHSKIHSSPAVSSTLGCFWFPACSLPPSLPVIASKSAFACPEGAGLSVVVKVINHATAIFLVGVQLENSAPSLPPVPLITCHSTS